MHRLFIGFALAAMIAALSGCAGPLGNYGEEITIDEDTPIEEVLRYPANFEDEDILIEGVIDDIGEDGAVIFVMDTHSHSLRCEIDGDFIIPVSAKTRGIRAQGRAMFDREVMQAVFLIKGCEVF